LTLLKKASLLLLFFSFLTLSAKADLMSEGKEIFTGKGMCMTCHTLKAAGSTAGIGPVLDELKPTMDQVKKVVTEGINLMPAFGESGLLTPKEIDAVSFYVAKSAGK
jgi:cytochrome c6